MAEVKLPSGLSRLAEIPGPGAVVDVPVSVQPHHAYRFLLAQTVHGRPILSGQAFRARSYAELDPMLAELRAIQEGVPPPQEYNPDHVRTLANAGFRFFVVHGDFLEPEAALAVRDFLSRFCSVVAEDQPACHGVYEINPHEHP